MSQEWIATLEAARRMVPDNKSILLELAEAYESSRQYQQAVAVYAKLVVLDPHYRGTSGITPANKVAAIAVATDSPSMVTTFELLQQFYTIDARKRNLAPRNVPRELTYQRQKTSKPSLALIAVDGKRVR